MSKQAQDKPKTKKAKVRTAADACSQVLNLKSRSGLPGQLLKVALDLLYLAVHMEEEAENQIAVKWTAAAKAKAVNQEGGDVQMAGKAKKGAKKKAK